MSPRTAQVFAAYNCSSAKEYVFMLEAAW